MELPASLHGNEYYNNLCTLRDQALERSHAFGQRKHIAGIAYGTVMAEWETEQGGTARLLEQGIRLGSAALLGLHPTRLHLFSSMGQSAFAVTTFRMELDDGVGDITVQRSLLRTGALSMPMDILNQKIYGRQERRFDLTAPTEDDLILLYNELARGASGNFH